jgi:hypothetical protein
MPLVQYNFTLDAGADWQKVIRLRDPATNQLVAMSDAVMEIRNSNGNLSLRLDSISGRCAILSDGASIQLHISAEDSEAAFATGNYPGANQAVGIWGIGRSYVYDLFALYASGAQDRIMRGFFYVDPNISQQNDLAPPIPVTPPGPPTEQGTVAMSATTGMNIVAGAGPVYRLWPATNGPAAATGTPTSFISGTAFTVQQSGCWLQGYWWWLCSSGGQPTGPTKCALWSQSGATTGTVVPGSVVTSGPLTPGWNYIPLAAPVPISIGDSFIAAIGCNGPFPDSVNYWGTTGVNGVTNGPLHAWGPQGTSYYAGGQASPWGAQGCFSVGGNDPSLVMPITPSGTDNFWVDVQIATWAPGGYAGSYRLWPNRSGADSVTAPDDHVAYIIGTEVHLSRTCTLNKIWYYSPSGATTLCTSADIWSVDASGLTGTNVATNGAPAWKLPNGNAGSAGAGWLYCVMSGTLPAGLYRVSVYDANGGADGWGAKRLSYWGIAPGGYTAQAVIASNDIVQGPLMAPTTSHAKNCYAYQGAVPGIPTPAIPEPGQAPFQVGPPNSFPNLYVGVNSAAGSLFQNYWVDLEVT